MDARRDRARIFVAQNMAFGWLHGMLEAGGTLWLHLPLAHHEQVAHGLRVTLTMKICSALRTRTLGQVPFSMHWDLVLETSWYRLRRYWVFGNGVRFVL